MTRIQRRKRRRTCAEVTFSISREWREESFSKLLIFTPLQRVLLIRYAPSLHLYLSIPPHLPPSPRTPAHWRKTPPSFTSLRRRPPSSHRPYPPTHHVGGHAPPHPRHLPHNLLPHPTLPRAPPPPLQPGRPNHSTSNAAKPRKRVGLVCGPTGCRRRRRYGRAAEEGY